MAKLPSDEWEDYMNWLFDTEYNKFGIPKPSATIFLDMPTEVSRQLLLKRNSGDAKRLDIHESDLQFMSACRKAALYVAEKENWQIISCAENDSPKPIDDIHKILVKKIEGLF